MKNTRQIQIDLKTRKGGTDTFDVSISSETPVERWDGNEILVHTDEAVDMSRFPLPLCDSHDTGRLNIGVVENPRIEGKKLRGTLRFGKRQEAQEIKRDVESGIISGLSVGYRIKEKKFIDEKIYHAVDWMPFEVSLVAVPADNNVGVGRNFTGEKSMSKKKVEALGIRAEIEENLKITNGSSSPLHHELCRKYDELAEGVSWPTFNNVGLEGVRTYFENNKDPLALDHETERRLKAKFDKEYGSNESSTGIRLYKHGEALPTRAVEPDQQGLDLGRFLKGVTTGNWDGAEREQRTMATGTDSLGGYLLPSPMSSRIIELARNKSVLSKAGVLTLPMDTSTLKLAKITQDATGYWRGENAAITQSDMGFGALNLSCKVLAALCKVSIELIEDTPNVGQLIEDSIGSALALELDRVGLFGIGAGAEPLGLFNTSGISTESMGTNGAAITNLNKFSNACTTLMTSNAEPKVAIYAPRTAGVIDLLVDGNGQPLIPPESVRNLTKLVSNQVPIDQTHGSATDASCAFVGDFSNLCIGMRKQVIIEATRVGDTDTFSKMQVLIRGYLRSDIGVLRADHFDVITGIIPA